MAQTDLKTFISTIAIILTFVGYAPYFKDLLQKKIRPHIFSWLIWGIVTLIIFGLQITAGAGVGAFVTLAVAGLSFAIFLLSLRNGNRDIHRLDVVFLVLAFLSLPLWLVVKQPVLSIVLLSSIDMLGFIPTIRKSWSDPYSETLALYVITTFRHALSIFGLLEYNTVTMLFPLTWVIANAAFAVMLIVRRKKLSPN